MKQFFINLIICTLMVWLSSCGNAKRMGATKTRLGTVKESRLKETGEVNAIALKGENKYKEQKIDSNINVRLRKKMDALKKTMDSAMAETSNLENLSQTKKNFRPATYKKILLPKLESLEGFNALQTQRMQAYMMLQDGLDISSYILFDLAAFFGPGKYLIPEDKIELARSSFSPLVDSIIQFSNKYNTLPRAATLVVLGFADAAGFEEGSAINDTLLLKLGKTTASKQELNVKLSELRAEELIQLLTREFIKKNSSIMNIETLQVEYLGRGKGEQYPLNKITDYKDEDERRRVVLCYWAVLPQ